MSECVQSEKLQKLINSLNSRSKWNNTAIINLLEDFDIREEDVVCYQRYNHPSQYSYGRNEIYTNNNFRIYLMSWDAGDTTAIHDHGRTDWGCVQFFSETEHRQYIISDHRLELRESSKIAKGKIIPVTGNFVHLMANSGSQSICTFHVYGLNNRLLVEDATVVYQPEFARMIKTRGTAYLNMNEEEVLSENERFPIMTEKDYRDYLDLVTPYYKRIGREELLNRSKNFYSSVSPK